MGKAEKRRVGEAHLETAVWVGEVCHQWVGQTPLGRLGKTVRMGPVPVKRLGEAHTWLGTHAVWRLGTVVGRLGTVVGRLGAHALEWLGTIVVGGLGEASG